VTQRVLRFLLIALTLFLALTAFAGGGGLLMGFAAPPVEMLAGTVFPDYTLPGLALLIIVGVSAMAAAVLLFRRPPSAALASAWAGIAIIGFEAVEVLAIGSPAGIARNLQIFYSALGLLILVLSLAFRRTRSAAEPAPS
jgi:NADH:ubiquinone oxidoreductase subunit 6 (subunit J)